MKQLIIYWLTPYHTVHCVLSQSNFSPPFIVNGMIFEGKIYGWLHKIVIFIDPNAQLVLSLSFFFARSFYLFFPFPKRNTDFRAAAWANALSGRSSPVAGEAGGSGESRFGSPRGGRHCMAPKHVWAHCLRSHDSCFHSFRNTLLDISFG